MADDGTMCIAVAVVVDAGHYLIGLRPAGAPLAGYWEFPGGKIRPGESVEQAAARECLEETGLRVEVTRLLDCVRHEYAHGSLELNFYVCRLTAGEKGELPERFRWVRADELPSYRFPAANAGVLEKITRGGQNRA